jgi:hypothetical protein
VMKEFKMWAERIIFVMDEATEEEVGMLVEDFEVPNHLRTKIFYNYCINRWKEEN